jgi:hypothetical protein
LHLVCCDCEQQIGDSLGRDEYANRMLV